MTLEQLLGELQALTLAYPGETQMYVKSDDRAEPLDSVQVVSDAEHLEIHMIG